VPEAVVYPWAVVVHSEDAPIANLAMMSSSGFDIVANVALSCPELLKIVGRFRTIHHQGFNL
jgi:hypothetical protein